MKLMRPPNDIALLKRSHMLKCTFQKVPSIQKFTPSDSSQNRKPYLP